MTVQARLRRAGLLGLASAVLLAAAGAGLGIAASPATQLNPTGKPVAIITPLMDGKSYRGDITLTIDAQDRISFSPERLITLLSGILDENILRQLRAKLANRLVTHPDVLTEFGITLRYDPRTITLELGIPAAIRARQDLSVAELGRPNFGTYERPARFSAYLNLRGSFGYVEEGADRGFTDPVLFLDGATRFAGAVLETQGVFQPGGHGFQRQGSRLVYDDEKNLVRWTFGDLQPVGSGLQSAPGIAGISLFRSYGTLQPQRVARPTGRESFSLERPSTVQVYVNDLLARRIQLDPGSYSLRDFPFAQGINDVRLSVLDDTGRTQELRFNFFFDQSQLAEGLGEFGLYAGVGALAGRNQPNYSRELQTTGFYRYGLSDTLTVGANFQADRRAQMVGLGAGFATPLGAFGTDVAMSEINGTRGFAARLAYQNRIQGPDGSGHSFNLSAEYRSSRFGPLGSWPGANPYTYELGASYFHNFDSSFYAGADFRYAKNRVMRSYMTTNRLVAGWQVTQATALSASITFQRSPGLGRDTTALIFSITSRLDGDSSLRADYDGEHQRTRLAYQTRYGQGVGSYTANADIEKANRNLTFDAAATYWASEGELSADHHTSIGSGSSPSNSRTNLHIGTSLGFADGAMAIGRPIYDSFALVTRHKSLGDAEVILGPTPYGYSSATTVVGTATEPDIISYAEKTIVIDVPDAPPGFDLGKGAFRLLPPYRSGYRLQVGSDYSVTLVGRLLNRDGLPVALTQGAATEAAEPGRAPLALFTNRDGRFGIAGMRPGVWRIEMQGDPALAFLFTVAAGAAAAVQAGDLHPIEEKRP